MKWTPISQPIPLPSEVRDAVQRLTQAGYVAYLVGGSVRDHLLGRVSKDHDLATDATPDELQKLFPDSFEVGRAFGVVKVPIAGSELLEIATFRDDFDYRDHRHPSRVEFGSIDADARRRDFSVNALYYDPKTQRILDLVGGLEDLKARKLRAIGEARDRFTEDALRLLRMVRFTVNLGFELDPATAEAARAKARLITKISAERVCEELDRIFGGPRPAEGLELLESVDLLSKVLPEVQLLRKDPSAQAVPVASVQSGLDGVAEEAGEARVSLWKHVLRTLQRLRDPVPVRSLHETAEDRRILDESRVSLAVAWAAVLHECARREARPAGSPSPTAGEICLRGAALARKVVERLRMPKARGERIERIILEHLRFRDVFAMREAKLLRWVSEPHFPELLEFHRADASTLDGNLAGYLFCLERWCEMRRRASSGGLARLVSGQDLIDLGLKPGPRFSQLLEELEDLTLEGKIRTREAAIDWVIERASRERRGGG